MRAELAQLQADAPPAAAQPVAAQPAAAQPADADPAPSGPSPSAPAAADDPSPDTGAPTAPSPPGTPAPPEPPVDQAEAGPTSSFAVLVGIDTAALAASLRDEAESLARAANEDADGVVQGAGRRCVVYSPPVAGSDHSRCVRQRLRLRYSEAAFNGWAAATSTGQAGGQPSAQCPLLMCGQRYPTPLALAQHVHGENAEATCMLRERGDFCEVATPSLAARLLHLEQAHGLLGFDQEPPVESCDDCGAWLIGRPMQAEHNCSSES